MRPSITDQCETIETRERELTEVGAEPVAILTKDDVSLTLGEYQAFEGEWILPDLIAFRLCLSGGGEFKIKENGRRFESRLAPGRLGVGLPNTQCEGTTPALKAVVLYAPTSRFEPLDDAPIDWEAFGGGLHEDHLIESVLRDLGSEARFNAYSSAYIDHCLGFLVHRLKLSDMIVHNPDADGITGLDRYQRSLIVEYIDAHLSEDLSVSDIANVVGYSRNHFGKKFKAAFGVPVFVYLRVQRMERAKLLLQHTKRSVLQISADVGYLNPGHFAGAFRRHTGMSPNEWRNELRK